MLRVTTINQRLSRVASQSQSAPSVLVGAFPHSPWTFVCLVLFSEVILFYQKYVVLAPVFVGLWGLGSLKINLPNKDGDKECTEYLCNEDPCPIHQCAHIFPNLPFVMYVLTKSLLVAFHIPGQIQCQFGFDCPSYIFVCSDSISVLFPGYLSLISPSVVFFFFFFFLFCFVRSLLFIIRMDYYWAWTRRLLTIKQPFCPLVSPSPYPEGLYHADP